MVREYAIYDIASMTSPKWDDVIELVSTVRVAAQDATKCILKWATGSRPAWIDSETITVYTHTAILPIANVGIWIEAV